MDIYRIKGEILQNFSKVQATLNSFKIHILYFQQYNIPHSYLKENYHSRVMYITRIKILRTSEVRIVATTPPTHTHKYNSFSFVRAEKTNIYCCINLIIVLSVLKNLYERHFGPWKN